MNTIEFTFDGLRHQLDEVNHVIQLLMDEIKDNPSNRVGLSAEIRQMNSLKRQLLKDLSGLS